jgi:hypothetical protein
MKRMLNIVAWCLLVAPSWAERQCAANESKVIDAEVRCVDQGGISIGMAEDEGIKVACMANKEVQGRCGPDGRLTRLHAYTVWFNKLKDFENSCAAQGGAFSFQDPNFIEPADESFCLQSIPEVGSNMFEEPLCNYRSVCPAVTVHCDRMCPDHTVAQRF